MAAKYFISPPTHTLHTYQFNLAIQDDKQVSVELKRSLEGKLPDQDQPVSIEIEMTTADGDSLVLEVWNISLDHR